MSTCSNCGRETKGNAKFCSACGRSLVEKDGSLKDKKARVTAQETKWNKPLVIAAVIIVALGALWFGKGIIMKMRMGDRPMFAPLRDPAARLAHATAVTSEGGEVRIPAAALEDGNAHFYAFNAAGKTVSFFVMKAADGSIKTAFDACMACNHAKLGYRQEGSLVVCNNCGMGFKPADIGMATGGCNPIVVNKSMDGKMVVLKAKDLEAGAQYF